MRTRTLASIGAALAVAGVPATASAAPVDVAGFTLTPSCVRPGGQVTARVTLHNNTLSAVNAYAQSWVTAGPFEAYSSAVEGPFPVPPLADLPVERTMTLEQWTPPGQYEVHVGVGPTAATPRSWSQRTAPLKVSYFFC